MRVTTTPLIGSSLTQLAISGADARWFVQPPRSTDDWRKRAEVIRSSLMQTDWLSALAPAFGPAGGGDRLRRAATSGFVVTTGQQPGLFGGPLYTWWKAFSALALANALEDRTGLPVAAVFWAATDDSDFAEASVTVVATRDGAERIEMAAPEATRSGLSLVPVGDLSSQLARLEAAAGSASSAAVMQSVRQAYSPTATVGSAYVELMRAVLEPLGMAVLDAAHPAVRSASHPLLVQALREGERIETALSQRVSELQQQGHAAQVKNVAGRSLVFAEHDGSRERVRIRDASNGAYSVPGSLGPNVLLRPIVERSVLPTVAYVGGPAEISYFAQVTAVADALGISAPVIVPRWSGMIIEPRISRILEHHGLNATDFRDPHSVETRIARSSLPAELRDKLASLRDDLQRSTDELGRSEWVDLVPPAVLEGMSRNVSHRLDRLERRFAAAVKRRGNEALRDAAIARGALFPFGVPQERSLNFIPLMARYGEDLMAGVMAEIRIHAARLA